MVRIIYVDVPGLVTTLAFVLTYNRKVTENLPVSERDCSRRALLSRQPGYNLIFLKDFKLIFEMAPPDIQTWDLIVGIKQ